MRFWEVVCAEASFRVSYRKTRRTGRVVAEKRRDRAEVGRSRCPLALPDRRDELHQPTLQRVRVRHEHEHHFLRFRFLLLFDSMIVNV